MFEYLMPALVMRTFPSTLLSQTHQGAVRRHIAYGTERGVPWGISESAYNVRDRAYTYQYRGFGVPDIALKRGLTRELVIAPYASALALMVEPHQAVRNLAVLEAEGYSLNRVNRAEGESARFRSVHEAYRRAPDVTRRRMYLETMERVMPRMGGKLFIDPAAKGVIPLLPLDWLRGAAASPSVTPAATPGGGGGR